MAYDDVKSCLISLVASNDNRARLVIDGESAIFSTRISRTSGLISGSEIHAGGRFVSPYPLLHLSSFSRLTIVLHRDIMWTECLLDSDIELENGMSTNMPMVVNRDH